MARGDALAFGIALLVAGCGDNAPPEPGCGAVAAPGPIVTVAPGAASITTVADGAIAIVRQDPDLALVWIGLDGATRGDPIAFAAGTAADRYDVAAAATAAGDVLLVWPDAGGLAIGRWTPGQPAPAGAIVQDGTDLIMPTAVIDGEPPIGAWRDGEALVVGALAAGGWRTQIAPMGMGAAFVWDAASGVVAWEEAGAYLAATIAPGGLGTRYTLGTRANFRMPALCATDAGAIAAFNENASEVYVARLDATGAVRGLPLRVSDGTGTSWSPALACNRDGGFVVAWQHTLQAIVPDTTVVEAEIVVAGFGPDDTPTLPPTPLPRASASLAHEPQLGIADGAVVASWNRYDASGFVAELAVMACAY